METNFQASQNAAHDAIEDKEFASDAKTHGQGYRNTFTFCPHYDGDTVTGGHWSSLYKDPGSGWYVSTRRTSIESLVELVKRLYGTGTLKAIASDDGSKSFAVIAA